MRIRDIPVFVFLCSFWFCFGLESKETDGFVKPFDDAFVEVCISKNISSGIFGDPPISINQTTKQVWQKIKRNGFEDFEVSSILKLNPSCFFKVTGEWFGGNPEPCAFTFFVLFEGMGAIKGLFEFHQMRLISSLEGDSQCSPNFISTIIGNVSISEEESEPVCLLFGVNFFKEGWIQGIKTIGFGITTPGRMTGFESSKDGVFADSVFISYLFGSHSRSVVFYNVGVRQVNPSHTSPFVCLTGAMLLHWYRNVNG